MWPLALFLGMLLNDKNEAVYFFQELFSLHLFIFR